MMRLFQSRPHIGYVFCLQICTTFENTSLPAVETQRSYTIYRTLLTRCFYSKYVFVVSIYLCLRGLKTSNVNQLNIENVH